MPLAPRVVRTLAGLLAGSVPVAASIDVAPGDHVPFRLDPHGAVLVAVRVNAQGPFTFLLDTGASHSSVSAGLARRLDLPAAGQVVVVTAAAAGSRPLVRVDRLVLGTREAGPLPAVVLAGGVPGDGHGAIDGVVGQDLLSRFNYTLDYRRRRLLWDGEEAHRRGSRGRRLPLERHEGRFLLRLESADGDPRPVRLVPDSGAAALVLFEQDAGQGVPGVILVSAAGGRLVSLDSFVGRVPCRMAIVRGLRVGEVTLDGVAAAVVERRDPTAPAGDGLLPLHLFGRVYVNSKEGYLIVDR